MFKTKTLAAFSLGILVVAPTAGFAAYPDHQVSIVVPYPPGGTTDLLARLVAMKLTDKLGQTFIVENKPGAGGQIGSAAVARSKPDGYTLLMGTINTHGINEAMYKNLSYRTVEDFSPVIVVAETPNVMIANKNAPFKTFKEFLDYAKKHPGSVSFGSTSLGGSPHMAGELLKATTGIDMVHVPYQGGGPMLNDVIGGQIPVGFDNLPSSAGHINAGSLRALAVTSKERWPSFPEVPTMAESGVPGYELSAWFGLLAPAGTPDDIVKKLNVTIAAALKDPEVNNKLAAMGAQPVDNTPKQFAARIKAEVARWIDVVGKNEITQR
ncbi:tripartite tricarboxylate transporter substrate binding protein [Pusillimonas sp. ANT_WB101]|uniref:Bug family tripartite tricarboxylate transporter substrate binding protein n=1 Tax=Pusillimonas sp. ANT_WB101 TaxID=2597356 RepID=UPI0011EF9149|nr:tripartite tricarboxylate transporter substrate binding protein [Pusillimonas sp. ANT_WB101]KAA0911725.1 tripartite tricarboxylate transporter substrate binding protein [Pusillimonas sp. ANT_WB101]